MIFFRTKLLILFSFIFFFGKIQAQSPFQIRGAVVDAQTMEPLSNVNIKDVLNPSKGTTTNEAGVFQIEVSKLPTMLEFTFLSYETQRLTIDDSEKREFIISLVPNSSPLPEITVSSKRKVDTVFFKPYSVVDYLFVEDKIFLLAHRNSIDKYTLIALNQNTHEEIAEFSLKEYATKGLFQHCTGEAFLVTEANVHKIEIDSTGISFSKKIFLGDFYLIEQPCVLANENFLYFAKYFYQGQALQYFAFAKKFNSLQQDGEAPLSIDSLEKYQFPLTQDEDNIIRLIEEMGLRLPYSGDVWEENLRPDLVALKNSEYILEGIMKVFHPKINAPIFQKGEDLMVFNHFESELQFFSEKGDSLKSIPIDYHKTRKWKKKVYFDEIQHRAYTTFNTRWGEKICEIDLEKGKLGIALPIDFAFIEKPKVRNGYLYFLYKDTWGGERKRKLHRMQVD